MSYKAVYRDAYELLCGQYLGSGIHRKVWACQIDNDLVVKVEIPENYRNFANAREMQFWQDHRHYEPVAKWLAPCEFISPDGRVMLQKRCDPVHPGDMPDKLPGFLTDHKVSNFGRLNGRIVCVDYALTVPNPSVRERKVEWGQ